MSRRLELITAILVVILVTAAVSHGMTRWLKIETSPTGYAVTGSKNSQTAVFMAGSSLAGDGIKWSKLGNDLDLRIESWWVAGSSPSEWEGFSKLATHTKLGIIVISVYDMNEHFLSDFHADLVPFMQSVEDLRESGADGEFYKRVLSMYPQSIVRTFFPSAGRSFGVIGGIREKFEGYAGGLFSVNPEAAGPTISVEQGDSSPDFKKQRVGDWPESMRLRRLTGMRTACQGKHAFDGPKKLALKRMLSQLIGRGKALVVVLPVSQSYAHEFLTPEVTRAFEDALREAQNGAPGVEWVRLDHLSELKSDELFWDLVHMNMHGKTIATEAFGDRFKKVAAAL